MGFIIAIIALIFGITIGAAIHAAIYGKKIIKVREHFPETNQTEFETIKNNFANIEGKIKKLNTKIQNTKTSEKNSGANTAVLEELLEKTNQLIDLFTNYQPELASSPTVVNSPAASMSPPPPPPPPPKETTMNDIFKEVEKLKKGSPQYSVYNVSAKRLEFSSDAHKAKYIITSDHRVLPNQTESFRKLDLHADVYKCSEPYIEGDLKFIPCMADNYGNIEKVGEIRR